MKKLEILELNKALGELVTPNLTPERGVAWLKGVMGISKISESIIEELKAIHAKTELEDGEKNQWALELYNQEFEGDIFSAPEDEVMGLMSSNGNLQMAVKILIINKLSQK